MSIGNVIKSAIFFLIGYIMIIVMNQILPPIFTAMETIFNSPSLKGILWFGTIMIWMLVSIVYPTYLLLTIELYENRAINTK